MAAGAVHQVRLPAGFIDKSGNIQRDAQVRAMSASELMALMREDTRANFARMIDAVLVSCVADVAGEKVTKATCDRLYGPDRDFLATEIRRLSKGDILETRTSCPHCKNSVPHTYDLSKVAIVTLWPPESVDDDDDSWRDSVVPHEIRDVFGNRHICAHVQVPEHDVDGWFRLPNGEDAHRVAAIVEKNPVEAMLKTYRATVAEWNGKPCGKVSPRAFEELPLPTLEALDAAYAAAMPGYVFDEEVVCPRCSNVIEANVSTSDFFFPLRDERNRPGGPKRRRS